MRVKVEQLKFLLAYDSRWPLSDLNVLDYCSDGKVSRRVNHVALLRTHEQMHLLPLSTGALILIRVVAKTVTATVLKLALPLTAPAHLPKHVFTHLLPA